MEGEVGRFRRNHLVPVPSVGSIGQLNRVLADACEQDLGRRIAGRAATVGERWPSSGRCCGRCPRPFDATETTTVRVDARRWSRSARTDTRCRSRWPGCGSPSAIGATRDQDHVTATGRSPAMSGCTASAAPGRCSITISSCSRASPAALARSLPLAQERDRGTWPECFDELWVALRARWGQSEADRQMVDVLMLCREHGPARVELAVRGALAAGAIDGRAVAVLARRTSPTAPAARLDGLDARLAAHDRPEPDLAGYDQLIGGGR